MFASVSGDTTASTLSVGFVSRWRLIVRPLARSEARREAFWSVTRSVGAILV